MILPDVSPHVLFAPCYQGVHLDEMMHVVPFHGLHVVARHRLLPAQSANPDIQALESAAQRFQLADFAAAVAAFWAVVEKVDAAEKRVSLVTASSVEQDKETAKYLAGQGDDDGTEMYNPFAALLKDKVKGK